MDPAAYDDRVAVIAPIVNLPDDKALTEQGIAPDGSGRVLVLACGALAQEITALIRQHGLLHVDLACLPAILHNTPERIVPALRTAVARHQDQYDTILVGYADCGTGGGIDALCAELGLQRLPGAHCYAFFEGVEAFAAHEDEITSFYLTDFLARQFDAFVTRPLGLDRHPELRDMYFGHYETVVYLAQTDDADLTERARSAAESLGLAFERRFTGYGDLKAAVASL